MQLAHTQPEMFPLPGHSAELPLDGRSSARLAADDDAFVASPVHRLQSELSASVALSDMPAPERYPGWLSLGFPVVASGALWFVILRMTGLFG